MPVTTCPAFVENAWKKDLCSNCFKGQEEHEAVKEVTHKTLTAQDSLTDLQLGAGRYFTLTPQFAVNARYAQQVHKWNDTVFQSRDSCESSTEGGSRGESADRSLGDSCQPESTAPQDSTMDSDVIERLDSLVLGTSTSLGSLETSGSEEGSACRQGILKSPTRDKSEEKKRGITFPDYEELQEIIGYGGDMYYSSEDDEPKEVPEVKKHVSEFPEEMTEEERNVVNMTKQNTSFNSHAPNLKDPRSSPAPRLGVDKKHTPIISVRPFVREQKLPGKVNMVSPMINGELVSSRGLKDSSPPPSSLFGTSVLKLAEGEEGSSRGEAKTLKQDALGSDGSTENSSSDSDSLTRDSPPPSEISLSAFDLKHKDNLVVSNKDASYTKQASFLATQIEEQKAKSSAATERLSFLSSQSSPSAGEGPSSQKVKPSNYKDEHVTKLTAAKAKLSLPNKNSSLDGEEEEVSVSTGEDLRAKCSAATARLSFLNSTMGEATASPPPPPPPPGPASSRVISEDNAEEAQGKETNVPSQAKSQPKSKVEKVVERDASAEVPDASEASGPKRNDSSKDSPKVKLTRKSPYVVGPYASTAILKGTPKPMITRKPPILKDKPKVPLKPNKLMMRSPSSSPSPTPEEEPNRSGVEYRSPASSPTRSFQSSSTNSRSSRSPVAAPRKASFRQSSEYVNLNLAPSCDSLDGGEPGGETRALVIAVSAAETKTTESTELRRMSGAGQAGSEVSVSTTSENSPPQVQKNLALKNKEALEAIRKSLSHKLISSSPPARVMESIKALETGSTNVTGGGQTAAQRTTSNSFEEARSSIADALQFRQENGARPSSAKRQAPKPPEEDEDLEEELQDEEDEEKEGGSFEEKETRTADVGLNETPAVGEEDKPAEIGEEVKENVEPRLAPAIRNSSMKSPDSCKNKDSKPRSVQFSPETVTVTVPSVQASPKVISYNRWMHTRPQNPYLESSFTGQPIAMFPPGVISHPGPGSGKKQTPLPLYAPAPIIDDEPRKWTEKKNKWRSKSTPRSSEIDEIMGSSKTKSSTRMGIFSPSSPQPIKRQSRVEIYESERKGLQQQKKGKFSLKKLFRGSLPEGLEEVSDNKFIDKEHEREILERQKVKVRPEIIHPLDLLNGGVEVVKIIPQNSGKGGHEKHKGGSRSGDKTVSKRPAIVGDSRGQPKSDSDSKDSGHDTSSIHTDTSEGSGGSSSGDRATDFSLSPLGAVPQPEARELSSSVGSLLGVNSVGKPKPAPPPRSQSLEGVQGGSGDQEVVLRPTSPDQPSPASDSSGSSSSTLPPGQTPPGTERTTIYANLGQLRSGLAPHKPQRTASMREVEQRGGGLADQHQVAEKELKAEEGLLPSPTTAHHFHAKTASMTGSVDSEAPSDSTLSFPSSENCRRKIVDGSEADSERDSVSPQRGHDETVHYGEEESPVTSVRKRSSRLSMRKGRSIVHKNLEDNYGAVITANHEAIAQILEQVCQNRPTPPSLRSLAAAMNLRLADFSVLSESEGLRTEKRAFFPATWGASHLPVTLMVSKDMALNNINVKNSFALTPIAQFVDQVPSYLVSPSPGQSNTGSMQAVVWALQRLQVLQFGAFAKNLKQRRKSLRLDEFEKDMSFVLLQLINGLKFLQAQGIEETIADLDNFLLARSDNDTNHRLIITEECHKPASSSSSSSTKMTLCQCALSAMLQLFDIPNPVAAACEPQQKIELPQVIPSVSMFKTMAVILQQGGSVSLGQVKSMLEYMLWGPSDIIFDLKTGREAESREEALQRWLDLERATVLNNLIRTQGLWNIQLTVYEEYHLLFLVRTCAKMLREASLLFESEVSRM